MRYENIKVCVYEPGDILDISEVATKTRAKKQLISTSKKAIVLNAHLKKVGGVSYRVLTDMGRVFTLTAEEQGKEKFLSHFDIPDFFVCEEE